MPSVIYSQPVRAAATGSAGAGASSPSRTPSSNRFTAAIISGAAAVSPVLSASLTSSASTPARASTAAGSASSSASQDSGSADSSGTKCRRPGSQPLKRGWWCARSSVPGGLWVDESLQVAARLEADGHLDALELTGGSSLANPMYLFRGDAPLQEFAATLPAPVRLGFRFIGHRFLRSYPYEEAFFLPYARQFKRALSMPLILLGGITELATVEMALAEGFAFVAMARALLREPDLPNRMQAGTSSTSLCIHCNKCMPTIYSGTRCVLVS